MTCLEQIPRQEIAENLDISPKAVSTSLYKARQRLAEQLAVFNQGE
jgi:DNA-directed RNA polymerase specialized sigma24 family protein